MNQVFHTSSLSGQYIKHFVGKKTYADSVSDAKEFAARTGAELISYFEQLLGKHAILVGYDLIEKLNEDNSG